MFTHGPLPQGSSILHTFLDCQNYVESKFWVTLWSSRSSRSFTTEVDNSSQNPVWSTKHVFPNIDPESLIDAKLDVAVWHFSHNAKQQQCLGNGGNDVFSYIVMC